jgi:hypothetical protein
MRDLTLTDLLAEVHRLRGDPSSTLIQIGTTIVSREALEVERENGAMLITLLTDETSQAATALRDDATYSAWRMEQHPVPANLTARQRAQAASYVEERAS